MIAHWFNLCSAIEFRIKDSKKVSRSFQAPQSEFALGFLDENNPPEKLPAKKEL